MESMEDAAKKKEILQRMQERMDLYEAGDMEAITAKLYSPDCVLMRTGSSFIKNNGVAAWWKHLWDEGVRQVFIESDELILRDDIGINRSHYICTTELGMMYETGKALTVWKKEGNQWNILHDMWTEGYEKNQLVSKNVS